MIRTMYLRQGQFKAYKVWIAMKTLNTERCSLAQSYVVPVFQIRGTSLFPGHS
uniref:Macaca fascicularis brain cDNA, clone: QflA-21340 n=1 Tax=Macaca fascicularis TaxID=9541 RepID=I7GNJ2_MACFA|nr:unnamed protein product [Macaca fascicularis]